MRQDKNSRMIQAVTIRFSNVSKVGTKWICYNSWYQLDFDKVLEENGFTPVEIQLAQTQVICRAVNPASELATARWKSESSVVMELTGHDPLKINKDWLHRSALCLRTISTKLEKHLSIKTNVIFDIHHKLILHDLTNTYFEGGRRIAN